jgi:hypothetical protein
MKGVDYFFCVCFSYSSFGICYQGLQCFTILIYFCLRFSDFVCVRFEFKIVEHRSLAIMAVLQSQIARALDDEDFMILASLYLSSAFDLVDTNL